MGKGFKGSSLSWGSDYSRGCGSDRASAFQKGTSKGGGSHRAQGHFEGGGRHRAHVPTSQRSGKKRGRRSEVSTKYRHLKGILRDRARHSDSPLTIGPAREAALRKHRLQQRQLANLGFESEEAETELSQTHDDNEATAEEPASASSGSRVVYIIPSPSPDPRGQQLEYYKSLSSESQSQHDGATVPTNDARAAH